MELKDEAVGALKKSGPDKKGLDFGQLLFNRPFLLFAGALALSIWLYWDGLAEAVLRWETQEEYSHGYQSTGITVYPLAAFPDRSQWLLLVGSANHSDLAGHSAYW